MKQMKIEVLRTNIEGFDAYALAKSSRGVKASDYVELPFTCEKYVESKNTITDTETGEVTTMNCLTIVATDGTVIGTNSPTFINTFFDLMEAFSTYGVDLSSKQLIIIRGQGKRGTFNTISVL